MLKTATASLTGPFARKRAEGKSWREAIRALKSRLTRIRLTCPELAGIGATPASIANASAERTTGRPAWLVA
jgi:hypothetical protein